MKGEDGGYYIPSVDAEGNLTWTASDVDMSAVPSANIQGPVGRTGPTGIYVGKDEPTDPNILIWMIPDGEVNDYVMTEAEVKSYIDDSLEDVADGAY